LKLKICNISTYNLRLSYYLC